jgi:hypothetical protein
MSEGDRPDEVSYGKPPKGRRFAKRQSGNPKGRPKGSKNLATIVAEQSRQRVHVNGRLMTKLELIVTQLANKAAKGDLRSQREYLSLTRNVEEASSSGLSPTTTNEADQKVLKSVIDRLKNARADVPSTTKESKPEESK